MKEISLNPDYKTMWKVECELNEQLKQQLESMTNKCAELNYDKNCLISDLNQSRENERQLEQQIEAVEKENFELSTGLKEATKLIKETIDAISPYTNEDEILNAKVELNNFLDKYDQQRKHK